MTVRGALRTMSAEDLLEWVDRRGISATMVLENSSLVRKFVFDTGRLAQSTSNEPGEHLGQLLLRNGLLDEAGLQRALAAQSESGLGLNRVLQISGAVAEADLRRVIEDQAREALCDFMIWTDGSFVVERLAERPSDIELPIALALRPCIVEARRRVPRWNKIRSLIPTDETIVELGNRMLAVDDRDDEQTRRRLTELVGLIGRGSSVGQLVMKLYYNRFAVLDHIVMLIERGALRVSRVSLPKRATAQPGPELARDAVAHAAPDPATQNLLTAAERRAAEGDAAAAFELARRALANESDNPAVQQAMDRYERALFAQLCRDLLTSFRVPKLLVDRAELHTIDLTENERYLAGRIDGRWDLLSLMRVSPLREVEALITFKRLADRGIISL